MLSLDRALLYLINNSCSNGFLNIIMPWLSNFGSYEFLIIVGIMLLFIKKWNVKVAGISLLAGLAIASSVVYYLKIWIARPRPFIVLPNVNLLVKEMSFSFPSGHSMNIFMVAALLSVYSKEYRYLYILAFIVAISRIYLGLHYPSDVIAGALLGIVLGNSLGSISKKIFHTAEEARSAYEHDGSEDYQGCS